MIEAMSQVPEPPSDGHRRLARAGLLCGIVDILWAIVLTVIYGGSVPGMLRRIAATAFGSELADGGWTAAMLGLATHFFVAFWWSAVFLALVFTSPRLRAVLTSGVGLAAVACVYGPVIWIVMSVGVVPFLTGASPTIGVRWWIQFVGHAAFVGLPIVWAIGRPFGQTSSGP